MKFAKRKRQFHEMAATELAQEPPVKASEMATKLPTLDETPEESHDMSPNTSDPDSGSCTQNQTTETCPELPASISELDLRSSIQNKNENEPINETI